MCYARRNRCTEPPVDRPQQCRLLESEACRSRPACSASAAATARARSGSIPSACRPASRPTVKWPVLTVGETPRVSTDQWLLSVDGAVEEPYVLDWDAVHTAGPDRLGRRHPLRDAVVEVRHDAGAAPTRAPSSSGPGPGPRRPTCWLTATAATPPTCRCPTSPSTPRSWPTWPRARRWSPTTADRRGCWCPTCTCGSRRSGSSGSSCSSHDQLGFWERNGYHHRGDPWHEERYSVDDYVARTRRRQVRADARERGF